LENSLYRKIGTEAWAEPELAKRSQLLTYAPCDLSSSAQISAVAHPSAPAFRGGPVLAIEFTAHVKWVLQEAPIR
jgi:hypothetical protein